MANLSHVVRAFFGVLIVCLTIGGYIPLFMGIKAKTFQPHPITYTVWSILLTLLSATLLREKAGVAVLMPLVSVCFTSSIAVYAWRNFRHLVKAEDIQLFYGALLACGVWFVLDNPLYALLVMMAVDLMAMLPTIRQGWLNPASQAPLSWVLASAKQFATLVALGSAVTMETGMYPAFLLAVNLSFTLALTYRLYGNRFLRLYPNPV